MLFLYGQILLTFVSFPYESICLGHSLQGKRKSWFKQNSSGNGVEDSAKNIQNNETDTKNLFTFYKDLLDEIGCIDQPIQSSMPMNRG